MSEPKLLEITGDLRRLISRVETLAQALDHYAECERSRIPSDPHDIRQACYVDGRGNAFESVAHSLRQILAGETPNFLRHSVARRFEEPDYDPGSVYPASGSDL